VLNFRLKIELILGGIFKSDSFFELQVNVRRWLSPGGGAGIESQKGETRGLAAD